MSARRTAAEQVDEKELTDFTMWDVRKYIQTHNQMGFQVYPCTAFLID